MRGSGYTLLQRLHFVHGVLNWACKPFIVLMLVAPAVYWFAGLPAFQADYLSFLRYGLPTLFALWAYNGWVSRSRTLPLFMEVTHTITALAITATLAVAAVKPFGRPFKVTEKGGDRSSMRVRWRLAALFGGLALLSALSIFWAFVAPDAASEISSIDYFNLVWAGIAMVLTFVAFLVCFEHPRGDLLFRFDAPSMLKIADRAYQAHIAELSTERATVTVPNDASVLPAGATFDLLVPGIGWVRATSEGVAPGGVGLRLAPEPAQHRALVTLLYSTPRDDIARQAQFSGALAGLVRRGLGGT
jgi:cellulose synthase (UDP-forming)